MKIPGYAVFLRRESRHGYDVNEVEDDATGSDPLLRVFRSPRLAVEPGSSIELYDDLTIECRPDQPFLVEGILAYGSLAGMFGAPNVGKSHLLLDLAYAVATETPWFGRAVKQGAVLYVTGEGVGGLKKRIMAIKDARNVVGRTGFTTANEIVQIGAHGRPNVNELVKAINAQMHELPVLIIIDTLSQAMGGDNENDAGAMNAAMRQLAALRDATGATVLVAHHSPWNGNRERGSTAFRASLDTLLQVNAALNVITLSCEKQRDLEKFTDIHFRLVRRLDSVVVAPEAAPERNLRPPNVAIGLTGRSDTVLRVLQGLGGEAVPTSTWQQACNAVRVPGSTFHNARLRLLNLGFITKVHAGVNILNSVSAAGIAALAPSSNGAPT